MIVGVVMCSGMASPVPVHGVVQGVVCVVVFEQFLDLASSAWIGTISSPPESSQQGMMTATEQRVHQGTSQHSHQWKPGLDRDPVRDATPLRVRLDDTLVLPDALYPGGGPLQEPAPGLDLHDDKSMPVEGDDSEPVPALERRCYKRRILQARASRGVALCCRGPPEYSQGPATPIPPYFRRAASVSLTRWPASGI